MWIVFWPGSESKVIRCSSATRFLAVPRRGQLDTTRPMAFLETVVDNTGVVVCVLNACVYGKVGFPHAVPRSYGTPPTATFSFKSSTHFRRFYSYLRLLPYLLIAGIHMTLGEAGGEVMRNEASFERLDETVTMTLA